MKHILLLSVLLTSPLFAKDDCIEVRAAFDLGSGATKMKVAEVNKCTQKITKVLAEKSLPVGYKESLKRSSDSTFDQSVMESGLKAMGELKKEAEKFAPKVFVGVATSAFRDSKNGADFTKQISEKLNVKTKVISQADEAKLGFAGAMGSTKAEANKLVAWDIGGGSTQITTYDEKDGFSVYKGQVASVTFKDALIKAQNKDPLTTKSPNPILPETAKTASPLIEEEAKKVDQKIKDKIAQGATVVGIGGVHSQSIKNQIGTTVYTQEDLKKAIDERTCLTDDQVGGDYPETDISNLILVHEFMKDLNIKQVESVNVNLTDGLLVNPEF